MHKHNMGNYIIIYFIGNIDFSLPVSCIYANIDSVGLTMIITIIIMIITILNKKEMSTRISTYCYVIINMTRQK